MTEFRNDEPHSPDLTRAAADQIAELVKYLAYATRPGSGGLAEPADIDRTVSGLYLATGRLPQVFAQVTQVLNGFTGLADAQGREVSEQIASAAYHLGAAHGCAMDLTSHLQAVQNAVAWLRESGNDS